MSEEITVRTKDNELTLAEMSETLPDSSTIMTRVGECWWKLYYAAQGGNWGLADYYMRRVTKLDNQLKLLRPKHKERLERFQAEVVPEVTESIAAEDLPRFERAYAAATDMANRLHDESGYPYIKWVLPDEAPKGLQLEPVRAVEEQRV